MQVFDSQIESTAEEHLRRLLADIPFVTLGETIRELGAPGPADFILQIEAARERRTLVCEVKRVGQPRHVREGAYQLRKYLVSHPNERTYGVLMAPYLSPESRAVAREESLGYVDFAGNCFLSFDSVFIERTAAPNPITRRRELREIFSPKASRVLRVLLDEPGRSWRVTELAEKAQVSTGQVSNVRRALLDREWVGADTSGVRLRKPGALLDAWRAVYKPRLAEEKQYYTLLHGESLDNAAKAATVAAGFGRHLLLASFSAARWFAPYARTGGYQFYADAEGEARLKTELKLETAARGANVTVARPLDDGAFMGRQEPVSGLWCTGPVQTYLDLSAAGDRGREAADHLRKKVLDPLWLDLP